MGGVAFEVGGAATAASYPGKLTSYVVLTVMAGAAGGLIFGYDLGISGTYSMSFFKISVYLV